jgi:hypothetical protein
LTLTIAELKLVFPVDGGGEQDEQKIDDKKNMPVVFFKMFFISALFLLSINNLIVSPQFMPGHRPSINPITSRLDQCPPSNAFNSLTN